MEKKRMEHFAKSLKRKKKKGIGHFVKRIIRKVGTNLLSLFSRFSLFNP